MDEILRKSWEIEDWKYKNCYINSNIKCQTCMSGGIMLGSVCNQSWPKLEKYLKYLEQNKE